jgi:dTDP-4-amino-4,6-dideoxygalactose transaminase
MGMCFHFLNRGGVIAAPAITWPGSYCMARDVEFYDEEPTWVAKEGLVVVVDLFGAGVTLPPGRSSRYILDAAHNVLDLGHSNLLTTGQVEAVVYSFGAVKQLSGIRGGMVISPHVDARWRAYRHYGVLQNRVPEMPEGGNFDMNEFSSALILGQLDEWKETQATSQSLLKRYQERLRGIPGLRVLEKGSGHLMTVWTPKRDLLRDALRFEGIETSVHYKLPAGLAPFDYPRSREWANTVLTLPLHSRMDLTDVDTVCAVIEETLRSTHR